jgi:hypothetical protein
LIGKGNPQSEHQTGVVPPHIRPIKRRTSW